MAIFHFSVTPHSRSKGHSAVNGAAYRAGVRLVDDRTGLVCDYSHKKGVTGNFIVLPEGVEPMSRQQLWDAVEAAEKRKNSTIARDIEASLPHELNQSQREELALGFIGWLVKEYGFAAEVSLHNPTKKNDDKNFHMHIYVSTRVLTSDGFTDKVRVLDAAKTGSLEITKWREEWANRVNAALKANNINTTVDHRSNAARGLADLSTQHHGNGPQAARIKAENAAITELNSINAQLADLLKERAELAAAEATEWATTQATQDVAQALGQTEKNALLTALPVVNQDLAGMALTPSEIAVLHQELAQPALTLPDLEIQLQDVNETAQEAAQTIAQAKFDHERASPKKYIFEAIKALPEALEKLEAAKATFKTLEAKGAPWYLPWRRPALERAEEVYKAAKIQVQDLKTESRAPVLEEVEEADRKARKQLAAAQAEHERIEMQMPQKNPLEPAQNAVRALLLGDAARAKAAADKIKNK